jgi:DNA-directed RNA polymerase subunit M/transcription elongation factor TFIIS
MKTEEENSFFEFLNDIFSFFKTKVIKKLSPEQIALLTADEELVMERCGNINKTYHERENRLQENHDSKCPNCHTTKENIVNKIREVHGEGEVDGDFSSNLFFGSGSVHGSMKIDTDEVNHCNKCGNEWKKYNKDHQWISDVLKDGLTYTADLIKKPEDYKWAKDFARIFDDCYAETIIKFCKENSFSLYSDVPEILCFSNLKSHFKSIWDDPNIKKNLQKLT